MTQDKPEDWHEKHVRKLLSAHNCVTSLEMHDRLMGAAKDRRAELLTVAAQLMAAVIASGNDDIHTRPHKVIPAIVNGAAALIAEVDKRS